MIPAAFCDLIKNYLEDRMFRVRTNDALSGWYRAQAGVPQGSVQGPILYTLFTADIPTSNDVSTSVFADDTALLATAEDIHDATTKVYTAG